VVVAQVQKRSALCANRDCQDVFVSKTGDRKEPILGWITNVLITQSSAS